MSKACVAGCQIRGAAKAANIQKPSKVRTTISRVLVVAVLSVAAAFPALTQQPTFGDLLERAQAQDAAGRRWWPAGDNMTETVAGMMDIIATATPQQLADLSDLLEKNASNSPAQPPARTTRSRAIPAQAIPAETADVPIIPPQITPAQANSAPITSALITPAQGAPTQAAPAQAAPTRAAPAPISSPGAQASLTPDLRPLVTQSTVVERPVAGRPRAVPPPSPRAMELYARGRDAERQGNVSGARRFFASAAEQGSAGAARSLGRLYDPDHLGHTALGGIDANPALARLWYERAVAMGDAEAGSLLDALAVR
jgi:TPR repeat protein